ncbi:hypothetical protein AMATHDRAFT_59534 [Amanita thiersii Skay4041]|uniref:BTB domain-containing protein n=1 Tax=Amanita thiersii Skay4041 TaxID=703135 RepID=A0A2A9NSJ1_9AGAR|nr:hypothetical protein AMATHDRAFT_59534 [Amanita thiersii Skay4041]
MVNVYVFNPTHKLRLLSRLVFQATKRILKNGQIDPTQQRKMNIAYYQCADVASFATAASFKSPSSITKLVYDPVYYKDESENGFCVFQVENTLFRVHRFLLTREPSAFEDMLCFPQKRFSDNGSREDPILLADRVEQFRDLLWALYALPNELHRLTESSMELPFERLLNIAELSQKYYFTSFESWSVGRIYAAIKDNNGPLRNASPELASRILAIAVQANHEKLLDLVTKKLISRILWHNMSPDPILPIAEKYGLRALQGICCYRQLTNMERATPYSSERGSNSTVTQLAIPLTFTMERRVRYFNAHRSLVELWEMLRTSPPVFREEEEEEGGCGCASRGQCLATWTRLWQEGSAHPEMLQYGPADVLGRLKLLMVSLRKRLNGMPTFSVQCTLSALEAIAAVRDEILESLMDHFEEA